MKVRYTASGPLMLGGQNLLIRQGDELDLPRVVVDRYAERFEVLAGDPPEAAPPVRVDEYYVGGGWYDLGDGVKLRRAEAEARVAAGG